MSLRRVVVTGVGIVSPLGNNAERSWDALISGQSGIHAIQCFDAGPYDSRIGGECLTFEPKEHFEVRQIKRMDRVAQIAVVAGREAIQHAGITADSFEPTRAGAILGSGIGGLYEIEDQHIRLQTKGPSKVSAFTIPKLMANASSGHIAIEHNLQAVNTTVATACASAGNAMGDAFDAIQANKADIIVTGGTEAAMTPLGLAAFAAMKALSTRNDDPERASRPFDKDRDGFVLSEGAGVLVFEEYEHAKQRGANILAEVLGVGASCDAGDMVQPDPEGKGAARAMQLALDSAGINAAEVDYINAHGTSTPLGDVAETVAIKNVFGDHAKKVAVSSTKSATGHTLGASGGLESIFSVLAIHNGVIPATINLDEPDEQCDLDYVPNTARDANVRVAMCNSFGFGGHNASLVFKKV